MSPANEHMLTLTVDAGNSHVKAVLFQADRVLRDWRFEDADRWTIDLLDALDGRTVDAVGASSVRHAENDISALAARVASSAAYFVSAESSLPFEMAYATPETLGPDRLASAVGAWLRFGGDGSPVVSMGLGTAITSEIVDAEGRFIGGSIAPGPALQFEALHRGTARLPHVHLQTTPLTIGDSTTRAIESGVWYGVIDAVRGRLMRLERELRTTPHVVLTGGWATAVSPQIETPHFVDPHLVHRGILHLMHCG
jgi:type III pantothenate kinase